MENSILKNSKQSGWKGHCKGSDVAEAGGGADSEGGGKGAGDGHAVVIAVSDASGRPVAVHCMDGAYHGSFDVALNKTYTSTAFQMSTKELSRLCQPGQDLYGLQFSNDGKVMILGGGEPLTVGTL